MCASVVTGRESAYHSATTISASIKNVQKEPPTKALCMPRFQTSRLAGRKLQLQLFFLSSLIPLSKKAVEHSLLSSMIRVPLMIFLKLEASDFVARSAIWGVWTDTVVENKTYSVLRSTCASCSGRRRWVMAFNLKFCGY